MRSLTKLLPWLCLLGLIGVSGCQKVAVGKTNEPIEIGEVKVMLIDPPAGEQTVTIVASATDPVDVYLCSEKDANEAKDKIMAPKAPLASAKGVQGEQTISGKAPAKNGYGVVVMGAKKKGTYNLKLTAK